MKKLTSKKTNPSVDVTDLTKRYYNKVSGWRSKGFLEGFVGEIAKRRVLPGLKRLNLSEGDKWLDIGCGPGLNFELGLKLSKCNNLDLYGIDIADKNVKIANKKIKKGNFVQGYADRLPYKNEEFDKVTYFHVIEHVPDPLKTLQELKRVLKDRGVANFSFQNKYGLETTTMNLSKKLVFLFGGDPAGFSKPKGMLDVRRSIFEIRKLCRQAGLDVQKVDGCILMLPSIAWRIKSLRGLTLFLSDILQKIPLIKYFSSYICLTVTKQ